MLASTSASALDRRIPSQGTGIYHKSVLHGCNESRCRYHPAGGQPRPANGRGGPIKAHQRNMANHLPFPAGVALDPSEAPRSIDGWGSYRYLCTVVISLSRHVLRGAVALLWLLSGGMLREDECKSSLFSRGLSDVYESSVVQPRPCISDSRKVKYPAEADEAREEQWN